MAAVCSIRTETSFEQPYGVYPKNNGTDSWCVTSLLEATGGSIHSRVFPSNLDPW